MKRLDDLIAEVTSAYNGTAYVIQTLTNSHLRDYAEEVNLKHRQWLSELRQIRAELEEAPRET